jgi:hypothetical protein
MAARKLGMTSVPVIELADLTPDQRRAYVQPNSRRLRQIASTWASLWVRGFYAYGTRSAIARIGWVGSRICECALLGHDHDGIEPHDRLCDGQYLADR